MGGSFPGHPGRGLIEACKGRPGALRARQQPFPGHPGRGLIEARASSRWKRCGCCPSPVIQAGASLKPGDQRGPAANAESFPGHPGRGLIEAPRTAPPHRRAWSPPSPVIQAGASLKPPLASAVMNPPSAPFPGHPGRGLIEAYYSHVPTAAFEPHAFPGHPGRGLIEATPPRARSPPTPPPSPVIQAGASLKHLVQQVEPRVHLVHLPRSSRPGPH